jgi:hypothetical protein
VYPCAADRTGLKTGLGKPDKPDEPHFVVVDQTRATLGMARFRVAAFEKEIVG